MNQPKFQVNDIVSDCDIQGEFIVRKVCMSDGFFYDYWVESLTNNKYNWIHCYEDELTLIRRGE